MIGNVFIMNTNFEIVGIVDTYKSLIWSNRYYELGDCELYVPATEENIQLMQKGYYVLRSDDEMVCRIRKLEIDTSPEDGNYLIVTGYDIKQWLDQRIIWNILGATQLSVENFLRGIVSGSLRDTTNPNRRITDSHGNTVLRLDSPAGLTTHWWSGQISYKNVGETTREYCKKYEYGYRIVLKDDGYFYFQLYEGTDRQNSVLFAEKYDTLSTTKCTIDCTNIENVALVLGAGNGAERSRAEIGDSASVDRYEIYVDGKDIAEVITWKELTELYPDTDHSGQGHIVEIYGSYVYQMNVLEIPIIDSFHKAWLQAKYPSGQIVIHESGEYYQLTNIDIANLPNGSPADNDNVTLKEVVYMSYLYTQGEAKLSEYGEKTSFEGTIIPDMTFQYKRDYFLGDIVTVRTYYGLSVPARITEIVEVSDDNGYRIEPKLVYNIS